MMRTIRTLGVCLASVLALAGYSALAQTVTPQGRLTLTSGSPVMTNDVVNATTVYYTDYVGNQVTSGQTFTEVPVALNSGAHLAGNIYDVYFVPLTPPYVCVGTVWGSLHGRSGGSASIVLNYGIWTNATNIPFNTCYNGTTSIRFSAGSGVYLGSIYMTGNGETSMQFTPTPATGGTSNILGVYNAYNRVRTISRNIDSAHPSWTDTNAYWELLDTANSTTTNQNTISFLDGLQQSSIDAQAAINISTASSSVFGYIGVDFDSTSANPGGFIGSTSQTGLTYGVAVPAFDHSLPLYGLHYVAAVEYANGGTVTYIPSTGGTEELKVELDM